MRLRHRVPSMGSSGSLASRGEVLPAPQVETKHGVVQGKRIRLENGAVCDMFHGIPYAKPPVGELRFKKPVRAEDWEGVLKCARFRDRSVQCDMFWDKIMQSTSSSEDCLYVNVYAPAIETEKKYPVVFYVHGGGFMMDSPARMVPKKLCRQFAARNVILVTVTYRLGYLGFFCTGDEACKGNMGMFDQAFALQWTKDNISNFGGNPDDITVAGQSAGGVSADLLSLSPVSRDLFKKKIVMGGSSFCHWAVTSKEEIADYCKKKARKLGWKPQSDYGTTLEENEDMMRFLRTVPAHKFATTMHGNSIIFSEARLPLAPVYDDEFLPRKVDILREEAPKMESIVGVGEHEALLFVAIGFLRCNGKDVDNALNMIAKKLKKFTPKEVAEVARRLYGDTALARMNKGAIAKLFGLMASDVVSNYACWKYMQHSMSHDKATYVYSFDYTSKWMYGWLGPMLPFTGGTHASEIIYLMDVNYFSSPFHKDKTDVEMCKLTADYFTSFVKTGDPNCAATQGFAKWAPLCKSGPMEIFSLDLCPRMRQEVFGNRMARVEEIVKEILAERTKAPSAERICSPIQILEEEPSTSAAIPADVPADSQNPDTSDGDTTEVKADVVLDRHVDGPLDRHVDGPQSPKVPEPEAQRRPKTAEPQRPSGGDCFVSKRRAQSGNRCRSNSVRPVCGQGLLV